MVGSPACLGTHLAVRPRRPCSARLPALMLAAPLGLCRYSLLWNDDLKARMLKVGCLQQRLATAAAMAAPGEASPSPCSLPRIASHAFCKKAVASAFPLVALPCAARGGR